jgi:beta-aspartyl-peptidase (threonine type)
VHGGAGAWDISSERLVDAGVACRSAALIGRTILLAGGSALDAVEAAVRELEDAPVLDAGCGSYLNAIGEIEMDALIMDGKTLDLGAVALVKNIKNPICLARRVMSDSPHSFLAGSGAEQFAESIGYPRCEVQELVTQERLDLYLQSINQEKKNRSDTLKTKEMGDTVGAVALDRYGNLAAATSTGGTILKHPGRIGDSPLVGSGAYADNLSAAASATGHGEALMKVVISKLACDFVSAGLSMQAACEAAIKVMQERVQGYGGLIGIDNQGRLGFAFNTKAMPHAYAIADHHIVAGR